MKHNLKQNNLLSTPNPLLQTLDSRLPTPDSLLQTVLVTGGAGYIGSMTVKELLDNDFNVVVLDSLENGHLEAVDKRAFFEKVDLSDKSATAKVFDKYRIDAVIDFAAYLAVGESMTDPEKYLQNNVKNFVNLLDVMVEKNCKYIIKSSTASTYGDPQNDSDFPLKEDYQKHFKPKTSALLCGKWNSEDIDGESFFQMIMKRYDELFSDRPELRLNEDEKTELQIPASVYGLTKLLDEILMKKYDKSSGTKSIALRYFNVCGADPDNHLGEDKPNPTTLMTMVIYSILGKTSGLKVFGTDYPTPDGTGIRDYIHPLDLASGHLAALKYLLESKTSNTFNLGCGRGNSVFEVIHAVESASGKKVVYTVEPRRSGDPTMSYANPNKAKELLNWSAKYDLNDMAISAWKWHNRARR